MPGFNLQDLLQQRAEESDTARLPIATSSNLLPDTAGAQPEPAQQATPSVAAAGNTGETVTVPKTDWLRALQVAGLALRDVGSSLQGKPTNFLMEQLLSEQNLAQRKAAGQRAERTTKLAEDTAARTAAVQQFTVEGALMDRAYKMAGTIDPTLDNVESAVRQLVASGKKAGIDVDPTLIRGMFTYRDVISKNLPPELLPYIPADPDVKREMQVAERKGEAEVDRLTKRLSAIALGRAFASAQGKLAAALPNLHQKYGDTPIPLKDFLDSPFLDAGEKKSLLDHPDADKLLAALNVESGNLAKVRLEARAKEAAKRPERMSRDLMDVLKGEPFRLDDPSTATPAQVTAARKMLQNEKVEIAGAQGQAGAIARLNVPEKASGKERELLTEESSALENINTLSSLYNPEFVGPVAGRASGIGERVGAISAPNAEFRASVAQFRNKIIKQITGAQMSETEATRIREQLPETTNPPAVFEARLRQTAGNLEVLAGRRREILKQTGVDISHLPPLPKMTLPGRIGGDLSSLSDAALKKSLGIK